MAKMLRQKKPALLFDFRNEDTLFGVPSVSPLLWPESGMNVCTGCIQIHT